MKLIGLPILTDFWKRHCDCQQQLMAWIAEVEDATWESPQDIKARYVNASFLPGDRVIFNIKGNHYRLDTKLYYQRQIVMIKRVGTHTEYNGWIF